jgi:hypothetical protein
MDTERTEYQMEALLVGLGEPDTAAQWTSWGGVFASLDDLLTQSRMTFLHERKEQAHSGGPQAETRVLDYRLLKRTVVTTEWEKVEIP